MKYGLAILCLLASPVAAQTFDVTQVSGASVNPVSIVGTGQALRMGDDSSRQVDLGFSFPFYGQTFTTTYISSNGFVNFTTNFNGCCSGLSMSTAPRNGIYAYWTDLISGTSPYISTLTDPTGMKYFVAEWNTNEYGTSNLLNFQIQLGEDGRIGLIYGSTSNRYHTVSAGITGPTSLDNIEFYYGSGSNPLTNTAFALTPNIPKVSVDCNATPNDPTCPPVSVSPVQNPAPNPVSASTTTSVQETQQVVESVSQAQTASAQVAETLTTAETITTSQISETTSATSATIAVTASVEKSSAERLSPEQLKSLLSGGPTISLPTAISSSVVGGLSVSSSSTSTDSSSYSTTQTGSYSMQDVATSSSSKFDDTAIVSQAMSSSASFSMAQVGTEQKDVSQSSFGNSEAYGRETLIGGNPVPMPSTSEAQQVVRNNSLTSQQNTLLALNGVPQTPKISYSESQSSPISPEQNEIMANLTATPEGFTAYQQTRLSDVRFYPPREIYRRNKPVDAYMTLYRLLQTGDRRWENMTEAQYGRR